MRQRIHLSVKTMRILLERFLSMRFFMKIMGFADDVYELTKQIPRGKISTYKAIAESLGTKAYRAVGQALHLNPHAPIVPCHRVIASDGSLHGFASGLKKKASLLRKEGVIVKNNYVDLEKYFYELKKKGTLSPFKKRR